MLRCKMPPACEPKTESPKQMRKSAEKISLRSAGFAAALLFGTPLLTTFLFSPHALRAAGDPAEEAMAAIRPEAIRADMRFLADDLLEGRGTATRGHQIAAKYIASQFEAMGLEPAGENRTYFQSVPLRSFRPDENQTTLTVVRAGKEEKFTFRQDFITTGDAAREETALEAPVVYVGYGVTAPEQGWDDYLGMDVRGKIVALVFGAPPQFPTTLRAHFSSRREKAANGVAHGAVGTILLDSPGLEQIYPFREQVRDLAFPQLRWLDERERPNDAFPELRGSVFLSQEGVKKLLEGSTKSTEEIYAAAKDGRPMSFALPVTVRMRISTRHEEVRSPNVVARLAGSDPALRDEYVVYTAHSDHLGIGAPVDDDNIYNGALDNASGTACLLEIARAYSNMNPRPRRSILFVSVTGEEHGLLGSDYFVHFPTVLKNSMVANVNMDGDSMLWPMEDVVASGEEHSSLGAVVREAAARLKLEVSPDPEPEQVGFVRSDQYSFVRQGIPAIALDFGFKSSDPKIHPREISDKWNQTIYHTPKDDMNQPFDFESGAKYARFSFLCGYLVAQKTERPKWNPGDFFGEKYGKGQ